MSKKANKPVVYAFIDSQNLNLGVRNDVVNTKGKTIYHGKKLDYRKFRHYLREKYGVSRAFMFIGMIPTNNDLYTYLQECGFTLVFKSISIYMDEKGHTITKGNVDTDIVLYSVGRLADDFDKAIFVSGDGDFLSLYDYMDELGKLEKIIVPNRMRYSKLLNTYHDRLAFVGDVPKIFQVNKKTRSSGRITSLGQPGRGDSTNIAKSGKKVNIAPGKKQEKER